MQMGSYEELVADKNGKYHELWRVQAQYYEADEMGQPDSYFRIWLSRFLKESVILYAYQLSGAQILGSHGGQTRREDI